jgi:Ni,Fe-hydrogenase III small subunit
MNEFDLERITIEFKKSQMHDPVIFKGTVKEFFEQSAKLILDKEYEPRN